MPKHNPVNHIIVKEIIEKLSTYNIFNYLLPGVIFVIISKEYIGYNFTQNDILLAGFLNYFIGMFISRFGSVILEPLLRITNFIKFEDYKNFVAASKKDNKIELLSEVNNSYRTICSMCLLLILVNLYSKFIDDMNKSSQIDFYIVILIILIMFLFAYRKQTNYVVKRVQSNL